MDQNELSRFYHYVKGAHSAVTDSAKKYDEEINYKSFFNVVSEELLRIENARNDEEVN